MGTKTVNLAGGEAFAESPKLALVSMLLTSMVKDQFYRNADSGIEELKNLIAQIGDKEFVAKAGIYARKEFGMRSITHVLAGEVAKNVKGASWTKDFFKGVVNRPDDITEILSYYMASYGKPIPNAMKKGLAASFQQFNDYQIAKYRGGNHKLSLVDAVNLLHPKSNETLDKLMTGKLKSFDTWEVNVSAAGDSAEAKSEAWADLIRTKKIGYFALLRNLRNIIENAPEVVDEAITLLTDKERIQKSLVLPFRYSTAVEQIEQLNGPEARKVLVGLNKALDISVQNVPEFAGRTLVVIDESGSMSGKPSEIASLFGAIIVKSNPNADLMLFERDARYITVNPMDSTLSIAKSIPFQGGGTNFHSIFETANAAYDRIIILSDMQGWVGYDNPSTSFARYKQEYNADPKVFSFDLAGYGSLQFPERNIYCLAGFSEKVFDVMKLLEADRSALVSLINKYEYT